MWDKWSFVYEDGWSLIISVNLGTMPQVHAESVMQIGSGGLFALFLTDYDC